MFLVSKLKETGLREAEVWVTTGVTAVSSVVLSRVSVELATVHSNTKLTKVVFCHGTTNVDLQMPSPLLQVGWTVGWGVGWTEDWTDVGVIVVLWK